jgi:cardiolipin synthase
MDQLLDAVTEVAILASREKVRAIANGIRDADSKSSSLSKFASTYKLALAIERLQNAWLTAGVGSKELASMLLAASHAHDKIHAEQNIQLVWTGPTTPFVDTRRTEQALLEVINFAQKHLFITSFAAYDLSFVVRALNQACDRGVLVSILLESSVNDGGSISIDAFPKMRNLVPLARLYAWTSKAEEFSNGRVHAKVAVADERISFITSANLTSYAMERNMEAGVLIYGGSVPSALDKHLQSLVDMKIISLV